MASENNDIVIIGGGHNGLVAANYLARAGLKVTVLERRAIVGGACVTEELIPGFKTSSCAFLAGALRRECLLCLPLRFAFAMRRAQGCSGLVTPYNSRTDPKL